MKSKKDIHKYLPSKQFTMVLGVCLFFILIIIVSAFIFNKNQSFSVGGNETGLKSIQEKTIEEIVNTDTDLDSIPDWEESLWGTDKNKQATFDNIPDSVFVENKKKELDIEAEQNEKELTETEIFARQFFTTYTALKSSGEVDEETLNNLSTSISQRVSDPNLPNLYQEANVQKTETDNLKSKQAYYANVKLIFDKYRNKGLGTELDIVNKGLLSYSSNGKENTYPELIVIGNAYKDFAKGVMGVPVPPSLVAHHLKIANTANNTGVSVLNMAKVINDPIIGLGGVTQYQKYSEELVQAVQDLESAIQ